MTYGFTRTVALPFDQAVERVTEELKKEGFGVLTSIDVKETLKKKINVDVPRYLILGACNPSFAHKALQIDDNVGLLLPCNVIVCERHGETVVGVFDPMVMTSVMQKEEMRAVAEEVQRRLTRVLAAVV